MIKRICETCGKVFYTYPSAIKRGGGRFCSLKCVFRSEHKRECICKECGKSFYVFPSRIAYSGGIFCSHVCRGTWQSKNRKGEKSPTWKGGKIKQICKFCGKEFDVTPSAVKKGKGEFCSYSCATKARRRNAKPKKTKPEIIFEDICKKYNLPFRFVGDGTLCLGRANPDFIHNARKLVCEVFGDFWHSPLLNRKLRYTATLEGRRAQLKAEGYKLIVLWEADLKRKDAEQFVLYTLEKHNIFPSTM